MLGERGERVNKGHAEALLWCGAEALPSLSNGRDSKVCACGGGAETSGGGKSLQRERWWMHRTERGTSGIRRLGCLGDRSRSGYRGDGRTSELEVERRLRMRVAELRSRVWRSRESNTM